MAITSETWDNAHTAAVYAAYGEGANAAVDDSGVVDAVISTLRGLALSSWSPADFALNGGCQFGESYVRFCPAAWRRKGKN